MFCYDFEKYEWIYRLIKGCDEMNKNQSRVILIGPGKMGSEYYKVLKAMHIEPLVIGRGMQSARKFEETFGVKVYTESITKLLSDNPPQYAIVASSVESLISNTIELLDCGIKNILVEKPAGIYSHEIETIINKAKGMNANVYVAYNRRFYSSVEKVLEIIQEDGGVSSFHFEFTEWIDKITENANKYNQEYKEAWVVMNSSHVIDLAFFLGGWPREISTYAMGKVAWHKTGAIYAGAGISEKGALFSYQANWNAPGRWGVEILTRQHRLYLKPMEKLVIQKKNEVAMNEVDLDDEIDRNFKPGLYREVESFLNGINDGKKVTIEEQKEHIKIFRSIELKDGF